LKLVQSSAFVITLNKMIVRYKNIQLRLKSMTLHDLDVIFVGKLSLGGTSIGLKWAFSKFVVINCCFFLWLIFVNALLQ